MLRHVVRRCTLMVVMLLTACTAAPTPTLPARAPTTPAVATTAPVATALPTPRVTPGFDPSGGPAHAFPTIATGDFERALDVEGHSRTYVLHVPHLDANTDAVPLVIVLHGDGGNAREIMGVTQLNVKADEATFVVAYPTGSATTPTWSANDVAFIRQLTDESRANYLIDPQRVYVVGYDSGGAFAYRLASDLSDRINAIAPIAAVMSEPSRAPARPIALLAVNSLADPQTPYERAKQSVAFWAQANGCVATPQREPLGADSRDRYMGCRAGANVFFYTLAGADHAWPATLAGAPTRDVLWNFFTRRVP